MTRKSEPEKVIWTPQCTRTLNKLKEILLSAPVMINTDFSRPFIVQADASDVEVGAIVSQTDTEGYNHPVAHFSWILLPREQKYCNTEKEYLAIKLGMEAFQVYLLGKEFTIQMDHLALKWLTRFKDNNKRIMRWKCHPFYSNSKRIDNANVDALSRQAELDGQFEPREGGKGAEEGQFTDDTRGQRLHHNDPTNID